MTAPTPAPENPTPDGAKPPESTPTPAPKVEDDKLGEAGMKALQAERTRAAELEKKLNQYEAEKKKADEAKLSELQLAQKQAQDATDAYKASADRNLRLQFAMENSVPAAWVDRLQGSTPEELQADWAILQPTLTAPPAPRAPAPVPNQGPVPGAPQSEDDLLYEQIYGPAQNRK